MTAHLIPLAAGIGAARQRPVLLFACEPLLDAGGAARAAAAFRNLREPRPIVWLDLSAVQRVSRAGIAVLSRFVEGAQEREATLRLIGASPPVRARLRGTPLERYVWQPPATFASPSSPAA